MASNPAELIYGMLGNTGLGGQTWQNGFNAAVQPQQVVLQRAALASQLSQAQRQQQQDAAYQQAVTDWSANGADPSGLLRIAAQFPDKAEAAGKLYELQDKDQIRSARNYYGQVYSGVQSNAPALAKDQVQRHRDALAAAGGDTTDDDHVLDAFKAGDTEGLAAAKALSLAHLYATDPSGFAKQFGVDDTNHFGTTAAGEIFDQRTGEVKSAGHAAPQYRELGPGQTLIQVGGGDPASTGDGGVSGRTQFGWTPRARNGGDNSDAAVDGKLSGMTQALGLGVDAPFPASMSNMDIAKALTLSEGGAGSLADRNNNPGNITDGKGGYRKFPTKEAGLAAAAAQVARNRARGQNSIRTMVEGLPVGGGSTGPRVIAQGAPAPGFRLMTPQENRAQGLDPNVRYQVSPNGQITALSGQDKSQGQLKPVPASQVKSILDNHGTLREIDRAIALLQKRPDSIGWGTGALGDWFTQRHDPAGVPVRAAVGKIGGKIIHDISGAAVTLSEAPRFQPYVPQITDSPQTALNKLRQLRQLAAADQSDLSEAWGPANGYRGVALGGRVRAAPTQPVTSQGWGKATVVGR